MLRQSLRCRPPLLQTRLPRLPSLTPLPSRRPESTVAPVSISPDKVLYRGPLTNTFKRLKLFSLSSFTLSVAISPFLFAIETHLPWSARAALAVTAITTSGVSTSIIAWAGASYVTTLRITKAPASDTVEQLELTTLTLRLRPRITRVFDPLFVVPTTRPFAKWELAQLVLLPPHLRNTTPGQEETVAETTDAAGSVLGRWVVKWGEGGEGACHQVGSVVRYFNVHEELLPRVERSESGADSPAFPAQFPAS
ncbi:hypothetical protein B0H17DRAFT_1030588 [Mycena rosella]|uniref:Uncharacterized protein n=1 Tax=Mycena rosella TaxID=1033263 RepID=A0AAD7H003_MYCRO|nr:hypothetical protein B0H17DRAFT_1030588 [Mycena rosella]